jgi:uncharacterized membrane protein
MTTMNSPAHSQCPPVAVRQRRGLHASALEASALVLTWPLIVALTELSWRQAFVAEIGLTLACAA